MLRWHRTVTYILYQIITFAFVIRDKRLIRFRWQLLLRINKFFSLDIYCPIINYRECVRALVWLPTHQSDFGLINSYLRFRPFILRFIARSINCERAKRSTRSVWIIFFQLAFSSLLFCCMASLSLSSSSHQFSPQVKIENIYFSHSIRRFVVF